VPVEEPGATVELECFLVANGIIVVAPRRELAALMRCSIALDGCLIA
jgi:hypothetical protein